MSASGQAGLNWAIAGKFSAALFMVVAGISSVWFLKAGPLGTYLLALSLLSLFTVSDFGSTGFMTVKSGEGSGVLPEVRSVVLATNFLSVLVFGVAIGGIGLVLFARQEATSRVFPWWGWLSIVACQMAWQCMCPLVSFLDGAGQHRLAWKLLFILEILGGLGLTIPLFFRDAFASVFLYSLGRALMVPAILGTIRSARDGRSVGSRAFDVSRWKEVALPVQARFFWVNLTGFASVRTIQPFVYYYQGAEASAKVGIAFSAATIAFNLCSGWPLGSLGRLSLAFTQGRMEQFLATFRLVRLKAGRACAFLLVCAGGAFELIRRSGHAGLAAKIPLPALYGPISLAHLLWLLAATYAVGIRATGRDNSAGACGWVGILSVGVFWWAASRDQAWWLPWSFLLVNVVLLGLLIHYWRAKKSAIIPCTGEN